jgi:hypothetical protein
VIKELDNVVLTVDLPQHRLRRGDLGTVVLVHEDRGYEVEFITLDGETLAVASLDLSEVRAIERSGRVRSHTSERSRRKST